MQIGILTICIMPEDDNIIRDLLQSLPTSCYNNITSFNLINKYTILDQYNSSINVVANFLLCFSPFAGISGQFGGILRQHPANLVVLWLAFAIQIYAVHFTYHCKLTIDTPSPKYAQRYSGDYMMRSDTPVYTNPLLTTPDHNGTPQSTPPPSLHPSQ